MVHDNYYKDLSHLPEEERALTNFDHPDSLDTELLLEHIRQLKRGETCQVPTYDFATHSRTTKCIETKASPVLLVEGILLYCEPEICAELDIKVYVVRENCLRKCLLTDYRDSRRCFQDAEPDIRLMRRLSRDQTERRRSVESVLQQYTTTVRPMHYEFVEPSKQCADLIVHSTTHSMQVAVEMITNHLKLSAGLTS